MPTIPGPRPMPLIGWRGNALSILHDPIVELHKLYRTYGPIVAIQGQTQIVHIFEPAHNHQVLSDSDTFYTPDADTLPPRFSTGTAARRIMNGGLLQMNGPRHKQQRRLMMPAFHKQRIEAYRTDIIALTERCLATWHVGESRDMLLEMKQLTLSIATKTLLGLEPDQEGEQLRRLMEHWINVGFSSLTMLLPFNIAGLPYRQMLRLAERLEHETLTLIERKRASGADAGDALSMLLQAHDEDGARLTDEELVGETATLFVAGHITTASALSWALFLLAQHPRVMHDLLDELGGLRGDAPTIEQLHQLPLLDGVIKETLRLLPPLPFNLRIAQAPFQLGPYELLKGTNVVWSAAVTHRIPALYPQPQRFMPERWRMLDPSPYEYIPFGGGPRRCLGAEFALLEMRLVLPLIVQRFRLSLAEGVKIDRGGPIFVFPSPSLPMRVQPPGTPFTKSTVRGNIHAVIDLE
jgi:cytochrome P450